MPDPQDPRRDLLRAWTERLYLEYDNILFHFRVRLPTPVIRIEPLAACWGQWSSLTRTVTISRALIEGHSWDVVIEVLKHEMAHQLVTDRLGGRDLHGPAFQQACRMLGVASWAAAASGELPKDIPGWRDRSLSAEEERLLKRAEKLLALADSGNEHEAALAMERVRQLYARYNLERLAARLQAAHVYCVVNHKKKRIGTEDSMIFSILTEHFFVRAIYCSHYDAQDLCTYKVVELFGTRENVLMAEYVCHFLQTKLAMLWATYRRRTGKGGGARRSYMLGVLAGFRDKLAASAAAPADTPAGMTQQTSQALLCLADRQLSEFVGERHPRLANRKWGGGLADRTSYAAGVADGASLTLNKAVTHKDGNRGLRLPGGVPS